MAFSMFVRNTGSASRMFALQTMHANSYSQKALIRPVIAPQIRSLLLKDIQTTTPILNASYVALSSEARSSPGSRRRLAGYSMPLRIEQRSSQTSGTSISLNMRNFKTTAVSMSASTTKDHSKLWMIERVVSVALVPLFPLAIMFPNKLLDSLLAVTIMAHTFWGFEAVVQDYCRPIVVGSVVSKVAVVLVYILCAASLGGLFYIIQHDIGIGNTIKKVWSIGSNQDQPSAATK